jgi:hypothetical protein
MGRPEAIGVISDLRVTVIITLVLFLSTSLALSQEEAQKETQVIGQIFDSPVPAGNYYFVKSTLMVFGNRWGSQPKNAEELEDDIWEQLVLSFAAFRRNIAVSPEERQQEIAKILNSEKVNFDWKKNKEAYSKWVKEKTGEEPELFENQIAHLLQLQKLRDEVRDSITPAVSDEEAHQAFLAEQNSIELELVQFDEEPAAKDFYEKARQNPNSWDQEKNKNPGNFKRPGFVTLIFLMDFWKIPKDDLYKMMKLKTGEVYPHAALYKGFGVFKVLNTRPADESSYEKMRYSYQDKVVAMKKYEGLNEWIKKLKQDANIKIYRKGG